MLKLESEASECHCTCVAVGGGGAVDNASSVNSSARSLLLSEEKVVGLVAVSVYSNFVKDQ
jgi:hypothetical protein